MAESRTIKLSPCTKRGLDRLAIRRATEEDKIVQLRNPRTDRYIKIDRVKGVIVSAKKSIGPYKGIPIVTYLSDRKLTEGDVSKTEKLANEFGWEGI